MYILTFITRGYGGGGARPPAPCPPVPTPLLDRNIQVVLQDFFDIIALVSFPILHVSYLGVRVFSYNEVLLQAT